MAHHFAPFSCRQRMAEIVLVRDGFDADLQHVGPKHGLASLPWSKPRGSWTKRCGTGSPHESRAVRPRRLGDGCSIRAGARSPTPNTQFMDVVRMVLRPPRPDTATHQTRSSAPDRSTVRQASTAVTSTALKTAAWLELRFGMRHLILPVSLGLRARKLTLRTERLWPGAPQGPRPGQEFSKAVPGAVDPALDRADLGSTDLSRFLVAAPFGSDQQHRLTLLVR